MYKEIEMLSIKSDLKENEKIKMTRFLNGVNQDIQDA